MSETKNLFESFQSNLNEESALRVFKPESEEYTRLQNFADELNNDARFQANYTVEDLYFDYGQNWMWTTIIAHKQNERGGGWQALTPRNQERVVQWIELDDVKQELLDNEEKQIGKRVTESDENFYNYVKGLLDNGSIDDPDYYNKLSDKEKEDLIRNTWMKDKDIINDYNNLNESETSLIKTYNETDGGYKNNATSVYGQLTDGNYYDFIPDSDYLGIFDAPVEDMIFHAYNTIDEDDTVFEDFAAEHEIINYPNREALYRELYDRYFGNDEEELEEASLSRLYQHTKDKDTFAIIGSQDQTTREDRSKELLGKVKNVSSKYPKIGFNKLEGTYTYEDGTQGIENSLIIYNIPKDEALNIADELNQESIIWKDGDFFGFLKPDGQEDGTFDNQDKNMSFDDKITSMYGSKLKGNNNSSKPFVFECCLVETNNIGSDFSKQNKVQPKKYSICKIENK